MQVYHTEGGSILVALTARRSVFYSGTPGGRDARAEVEIYFPKLWTLYFRINKCDLMSIRSRITINVSSMTTNISPIVPIAAAPLASVFGKTSRRCINLLRAEKE